MTKREREKLTKWANRIYQAAYDAGCMTDISDEVHELIDMFGLDDKAVFDIDLDSVYED